MSRDVWSLEAFFPKSKFEPVWPRLKVQNVWSKLSRVPMPPNIQWKTWRHSLEIATKSAKSCVSVRHIFGRHLYLIRSPCQVPLYACSTHWLQLCLMIRFSWLGKGVPCCTSRNQDVISQIIFILILEKAGWKMKAGATC